MTFKSKYFALSEQKISGGPASAIKQPGEVARGDSWHVVADDGGFVLHYLSGELAGRSKTLSITSAEVAALQSGEADIDAVLIAHGAY
jgi:hypothetical protein